jgi:hypothetical protein
VLKAKNAWAGALYNMGRTLEAAVLYKKVFDARLKVLGKVRHEPFCPTM